MWIDEDPTGSHGYSVFDEIHVCNWLDQFELNNNPTLTNVNLDEPSRAYWVEALNIQNDTEFINLITEKEITDNNGGGLDKKLLIDFSSIVNTDSLIFYIVDEWIDRIQFSCNDIENINS